MTHKGILGKSTVQCIKSEGADELSLGKHYELLAEFELAGVQYVTVRFGIRRKGDFWASRFIVKPTIIPHFKKDFK